MLNRVSILTKRVFDHAPCGRGIGTFFYRENLKNLLPCLVLRFQTQQNINYRVSDLFFCSGLGHFLFSSARVEVVAVINRAHLKVDG
jgi:hypothetical protein